MSLDEAPITDINITPLVDVCLVLVIIFMVTAPLFSDPAIKVRLPSARTHEGEETDKVTLTLAKDGRTALDQETFADVRDLEARLKAKLAASGSKLVILRADADAEYGPLTDLMSRAKDAGAQSLTIATERRK
ncbi:MAG: biopolymer transporter ExbD [Elusimicrobia bacterium]|nr:biopolymer transporter ExbD [Elusimicrobiota bacterium]